MNDDRDLAERRRDDLRLADQSRLNLLWIHGIAAADRVLDLRTAGFDVTAGLQAMAREVITVDSAVESSISCADAQFEIAVAYGAGCSEARARELKRVIRPGGHVLVAASNRWWASRVRGLPNEGTRESLAGVRARLLDAGFEIAAAYWIDPSLATPRSFVPARRARVIDLEAARRRESGSSLTRLVFANLGLAAVLYPAFAVLARAP